MKHVSPRRCRVPPGRGSDRGWSRGQSPRMAKFGDTSKGMMMADHGMRRPKRRRARAETNDQASPGGTHHDLDLDPHEDWIDSEPPLRLGRKQVRPPTPPADVPPLADFA